MESTSGAESTRRAGGLLLALISLSKAAFGQTTSGAAMEAICIRAFAAVLLLLAGACGGGGGGGGGGGDGDTTGQNTPVQISGSVSGLNPGLTGTVVLGLAAGGAPTSNDVSLSANGAFTFADAVQGGQAYMVVVKAQPPGQYCAVSNGTGVASGNVTNVSVACQRTWTVIGSVSGLNGPLRLTLFVNGGPPISLRVDGSGIGTFPAVFAFPFTILPDQSYLVQVASSPPGQNCTIANATGIAGNADVTGVSVSCTTIGSIPTYRSVGGTVSGSLGRVGLTMQVGGDVGVIEFVSGDGAFTLVQRLILGQTYTVRVSGSTAGQTCSVSNGSGVISSTNVTNVSVTCSAGTMPSYTVGGSVSGLNGSVVLRLLWAGNVMGDLIVNTNGPFTFTPMLGDAAAYTVMVESQPNGQHCTVSHGAGLVIESANVSNVSVVCASTGAPTTPTGPSGFTVGGSVSGLTGTLGLNLTAGGSITSGVLTANGGFTFPRQVSPNQSYLVSVQSQPTGQHCSVSNGSGIMGTTNVTTVSVACTNSPPPTLNCGERSGAAIGGLGFINTMSYSDLSPFASTFDPSITTGYSISYYDPTASSSAFTGSLRIRLWAVASSFSGGTITGTRIATFTPNFIGAGARASDQLFNGATVNGATSTSSGTTPAAGTYCIVMALDEFTNNCGSSDGFCYSDWIQFRDARTFQ